MAKSCKDSKTKGFCIIQFKELPYQSIDVYVCVPKTWIIVRCADRRAVVAYPNDEEPFETKARVIRQERCDEEGRFYLAYIKYESDSYCDAEYWIATNNDNGSIKEDKDRKYTVPTPMLVKKRQSFSLCLTLNSSGDKPKWIPKINKAAESNNITMRTNIKPWSSKRNPTIVIRNNQLISAETKESSATSNSKKIEENQ